MQLNTFFFYLHSGLRWIAMLALAVAFIWLLVGMLRGREYDRLTHRIMVIFSSLVGLQWVVGILTFLFWALPNPQGPQWVHLIIMTLTVAAAHMYIPLKSRADSIRYRGGLAVIIATLALIIIGVAVLGGNRWGFAPSILG